MERSIPASAQSRASGLLTSCRLAAGAAYGGAGMPPFHKTRMPRSILQAEVEFFQEGEGMVALFGVA